MMTEIFWTFVITSSVAFIIKIASLCFKSKCKQVDICCIRVIRDTEIEERELEFTTNNNNKLQKDNSQNDSPNLVS